MGAGADFQINIGLGHPQVIKEGLAHFLVVVLPSMNEKVLNLLWISVHRLDDRGHFHKIRACADDIYDFQKTLPEKI